MKKEKTGFLFVILSFFFCFAVSAYGATEKNTTAYFDSVCIAPADSSEASAIDGVKLKIKKSYLSNEQFGTKKIRSIRPGQSDLWGVYNVTLSGGDDWLLREYSIPAFGYLKDFYDHHSPGKIHFSWGGWEIPDNKAIGNKSYTFEYCITGDSEFTKTKKLKFKIKRDAITNSTRAYFEPKLPKELKKSIIKAAKNSRKYLKKSKLKYKSKYVKKTKDVNKFLKKELFKRYPSAYLIHSHGNSADGGRIYFLDDSYLNAADLAASGYEAPAGLFYAAVCEGATYDTLGDAFVAAGYDAYIGYTVSVYTDRNRQFYERFFEKATVADVSVATALADNISWANGLGWTDVATAKIIGDGANVYLGCKTTDGDEVETPEVFDMTGSVIGWRDIDTFEPTDSEKKAVEVAQDVAEVKQLRAKYGDKLVTGIEIFPDVHRVAYRVGDIFVYAVDVDEATGKIVAQGELD